MESLNRCKGDEVKLKGEENEMSTQSARTRGRTVLAKGGGGGASLRNVHLTWRLNYKM